jgi:starch phosphorylase
MFPRHEIHQITNGVHSRSWTCAAFKSLFDRYIPGARRATAYQRPDLILSNPERLRAIARHRPRQLIFAGKAHPRDGAGKALIEAIIGCSARLGDDVPLLYLEDYDSFFNTHRMVRQYQLHAYAPARRPAHRADEARPGA